nr:hypothetical protein [Streptomyces cinnamoneus]
MRRGGVALKRHAYPAPGQERAARAPRFAHRSAAAHSTSPGPRRTGVTALGNPGGRRAP